MPDMLRNGPIVLMALVQYTVIRLRFVPLYVEYMLRTMITPSLLLSFEKLFASPETLRHGLLSWTKRTGERTSEIRDRRKFTGSTFAGKKKITSRAAHSKLIK
jgi:hypothetical protein